jgi:hypothetical protein
MDSAYHLQMLQRWFRDCNHICVLRTWSLAIIDLPALFCRQAVWLQRAFQRTAVHCLDTTSFFACKDVQCGSSGHMYSCAAHVLQDPELQVNCADMSALIAPW